MAEGAVSYSSAVVVHYFYPLLQVIEDDELVCSNIEVIRSPFRGKLST